MNTAKWQGYWEEHAGRLMWLVLAVWTILVGASLIWNLHQAREFIFELARNEANLSFEKDLAYRLWAAKHGGVYVPATPESPPNPYLSQVHERDIQTPAGRSLTLVNPAYMTRQVHELTAQLYGSRGHLTSLRPLRPENAPDAWESKALKDFEGGRAEVVDQVNLAGQPYLRLMRPWRTEQICLKCHAGQGYRVGDIRGGISVAVQLQPYLAGIRTQTQNLLAGHGLIWLLGVAGIGMGGRRIRKHLQGRRQAEAELAETLRQKEEALAQLERLASFPRLNPNPVLEIEPQGVITFANQAAADVLEQLASDVSLRDFLPANWQEVEKSIRETGGKNYECEVRLKDRVFSESIAFAEPFEVWRIYARDITERKKAEAASEASKSKLEAALASMTNAVFISDTEGRFIHFNEAFATFHKFASKDECAKTLAEYPALLEVFLPNGEPAPLEQWAVPRALRGETATNAEYTLRRKDTWVGSYSFAPVRDKAGVIIGSVVSGRDITELKQAEAALRESQEQAAFLADLLENSSQPFGVGYPDGRLGTCNSAYAQLLGYSKEEFLTLDWARDLTPPEWLEIEQAKLAELQRNEEPVRYEKEYWHKDGSRVPVEIFVNVRRDDLGQPLYYYAFVTDITERRQAEAKLRESEARFRSLFENMTEGVVVHEMIFDRDGRAVDYRILAANLAFEKHTGLKGKQLEGQPASQAYGTGAAPYLEIYSQVAQTGQPTAFETYFPPLQRYFHISATSPKKDYFVTVFEDITERRNMEEALRQHTSELSRVVTDLEQKNAEIERFTYMISHDLKSPLVTISTFLGYLEKDMASGDTGRVAKDMQHMYTAADKMGRLLKELLEMSRIGRMINPPVKVTFRKLVEEALNAVAGPLSGRGLDVEVRQAEITFFGDRPRLAEIWQILVENAVKFMGEQPEPRLTIGAEGQGPDTVFFVCDNGIGIDSRYQEKIFGIFEKLDSTAEGTGIGLALAKRIVELHQGKIWVESAGLGQGSCFRFTLPGAVREANRETENREIENRE